MKTIQFTSRNLWLAISLATIMVGSCKSQSAPEQKQEEVIEQPKPATEAQTDSLKRMLDQQRDNRLKNK
jgi:hypothetical protein